MESPPGKESARARLVTELKRYAFISLYLFVCFGVLIVYETSQSPDGQGHLTVLLGVALGKALVLGKFILIGDVLEAGVRKARAHSLVHRVAWRTAVVVVVLVVLKLVEEWIVGILHGKSTGQLIEDLIDRPWPALAAPLALMLLILIPLITASELRRALGARDLKRLWLGPAE